LDDDEEEEYGIYADNSEEGKQNNSSKTKHISDISREDLVKTITELHVPKTKQKKNPKCKKKMSAFRSATIVSSGCSKKPCRQKEPLPQEQVYTHRTVEIGVYIDKALYNQVSEEMGTKDSVKIKERLVECVHGIFLDVENFLTHKTFTSLSGGFKVALNGIHIYKDDDDYSRKWSKAGKLTDMLKRFEDFAYEVNGACDAEQDSYDAMVLFTGRGDELADVGQDISMGYAFRGAICKIAPTTALTLRLDGKGMHDLATGRLLSHEFGHLFGSNHDGEKEAAACPRNVNLMSSMVPANARTWSECTKNMVDSEDKHRKRMEKDCFFT